MTQKIPMIKNPRTLAQKKADQAWLKRIREGREPAGKD